MLAESTEAAVAEIANEAREAFGDRLLSMVLYGSAAGDEYVVGRSDLNFAIVLDAIGFDDVLALQRLLPSWHRHGAASPLFIDREFLSRARDVFPLELLDIQAEHCLLVGEDVFSGIAVDFPHLRFQLEQEARAKLLRLRVLFAESAGDRSTCEELILDSVKTFVVLLRALQRLRADRADMHPNALLDDVEHDLGMHLPTIREAVAIRAGRPGWSRDLVDAFRDYLAEVEQIVGLVDRITHGEASGEGNRD